jgi:hypothetical protein
MSFSNAPDNRTLGRVAGALAVDEAFVEKDWYVVQAIRALLARDNEDLKPVFSGGTSLLKGYGLIKRFSEDIDFKFQLSDAFEAKSANQKRKALGNYRDALVADWEAAGFTNISFQSRDANGFLKIEMDYPSLLEPHDSLRPHILAELSAKPPRLPAKEKAITSFVSQYARLDPEVSSIKCVDPVETAADKLSAFAWRMLGRNREDKDDDPTIVRHLHDLAVLEAAVGESPAFAELLASVLDADAHRGGKDVAPLTPMQRLRNMNVRLANDKLYASEYQRFVGGMAFAGGGEIPDFISARKAIERLSAHLLGS